MSIKLEVGKKYLDVAGYEWEVTGIMNTPTETLYGVKGGGLTTWLHASSFISEVPTTPEFKVGDRVRVHTPAGVFPGTIETMDGVGDCYTVFDGEVMGNWFPSSELTLLDDTTPTHVPCKHIYANQSFMGMDMRCKHCGEKQ